AEPAERADHLVGHEQYVVAVVDLANPLEVARWGREATAGVLHRLQEDRGHRVRAFGEDDLLDPIGSPPTERHDVVTVFRGTVEVRVRYSERTRHQRLVVVF